jgi:hypothetical protein
VIAAAAPRRAAVAALVAVTFAALAARLALLVDRFAVTLPYWDQWDFLNPLFEERGWLELFTWQHGPHRQGVGGVIYGLLYPATAWSSRAEAFVAWAAIAAAAALAIVLLRRAGTTPAASDVAVPLACFSYSSYELFFGAQNLANGPLPLLLVVAAAWGATASGPWRRSLALAASGSLAIFTGFGLLLAPVLAALFVRELARRRASRGERPAACAGLAALAAAAGAFAVGYRWLPASDCLEREPLPWVDYAAFLAAMSGRAWGTVSYGASRWIEARLALGLALWAAGAAVALTALARRPEGDARRAGRHRALVVLCGFSALFALVATSGRACLGPHAALAPRYTIYAVPGLLGLYLAARGLAVGRRRTAVAAAIVALLAAKELRSRGDWESSQTLSEGRRRWVGCYLEHRDVDRCDRETGFAVYPADRRELTRLDDKLRFLEARSLSLFAPAADGPRGAGRKRSTVRPPPPAPVRPPDSRPAAAPREASPRAAEPPVRRRAQSSRRSPRRRRRTRRARAAGPKRSGSGSSAAPAGRGNRAAGRRAPAPAPT